MDWYAMAGRAQEPQRTDILTAAVDLWCAHLAAQADLDHLGHALGEDT